MPVKNIKRRTNDGLQGTIVGLTDEEKQALTKDGVAVLSDDSGALKNKDGDYISLLYQNAVSSLKEFNSYKDLLDYVKSKGANYENGGIFMYCKLYMWIQGYWNYSRTFYFLGQMTYDATSNEELKFSGWYKGDPSWTALTHLTDNWHPYSGNIPRNFTYISTMNRYVSEYSNNWDINAYFSEEGDYYLGVKRAFTENGSSNYLRYNNITAKKLPNKYHTITIKNEQKILFTTTMPSTVNTIIDSYANLKTLFGGELLAGFGEYCQLDLRGGTEATDKLIKLDGTEATLASLGAIVYTDVCFLPK